MISPKMREAPEGAPDSHLADAAGSGSVIARDFNDGTSLTNLTVVATPVSVASTPRGGVLRDGEAMRRRRTVGVGYRARCAYRRAHKREEQAMTESDLGQ
jgi:hypothetical protein